MKELLPVKLNIYKFSNNPILSIFNISLYHTAIEFADTEFAFGNNCEEEGIYYLNPKSYNSYFIESITLGNCDRRTFFKALEKLKVYFKGNTYNILFKNCNHFTNSLSRLLFEKELPKKYTKLLSLGDVLRKVF
jgi:hypothetical protein